MLDPQPEPEGSGAEPDVNSTINANLTTISTEIRYHKTLRSRLKIIENIELI